MNDRSKDGKPLGLREVVSSVLAAAFGVQSGRNRERDFKRGSARQFILVGLVGTALFVLAVYGAVKLVLGLAAG